MNVEIMRLKDANPIGKTFPVFTDGYLGMILFSGGLKAPGYYFNV